MKKSKVNNYLFIIVFFFTLLVSAYPVFASDITVPGRISSSTVGFLNCSDIPDVPDGGVNERYHETAGISVGDNTYSEDNTIFTNKNHLCANPAEVFDMTGISGTVYISVRWETVLTGPSPFSDWYYFVLNCVSGVCNEISNNQDTRIVSVSSPLDESVQSTTTTFSGTYYVASTTIATTSNVFMYLYIQNRSNDVATSSLNDYMILNFPVTALDTILTFSTTTSLQDNSRYSWNGGVRRGDTVYGTVPFSDGKEFYQFTTGSFDPTFGKNFNIESCNPFSGFNIAQCIYGLIFPNNVTFPIVFNEAKNEFGTRVPWGYVTRVLSILNATTTSTVMPTIDYSFASSSPMSSIGNIHFEPFTLISQSGALIDEMKSDRTDSKTVWEIFMPFINMFVYIVLLFMIIHDLTGIHSHKSDNDKQKE